MTERQVLAGGSADVAVRLICLPASDHAFSDHVHELVESEGLDTPAALEARLRRVYPTAAVRPRDLVEMVADAWYVYREAPYSPPKAEAWWQSEAAAHVAVTFAGVAVEANDALLTLLAARREELIGAHYSRFVPSDALPDAARLLAIVLRRTSGDSIVTLLRRDGRRIPVEWHAQVRGTRLHAWFRPTT